MKVQKMNPRGEVVYQYKARMLLRQAHSIQLEAFFDREDMILANTVLKKGDRFVETFFSDRWYNIFEIYDHDDGHLKGWYCNIGKPAVIQEDTVAYVDLILDLWVASDGTQTVLDEDELESMNLDEELKQKAYQGLRELQMKFNANTPPQ